MKDQGDLFETINFPKTDMNTKDRHESNDVDLKFRFQIIQVRSMPLVQNVMNEFCVDTWKKKVDATNINRGR